MQLLPSLHPPGVAHRRGVPLVRICHRASAIPGRRGHRPPRHRHYRSLLLAMRPRRSSSPRSPRIPGEVAVMKILRFLWKNLRTESSTLRFPAPPATMSFREESASIRNSAPDAPCAASAAPRSHPFHRGRQGLHLGLQPRQCTFCGRCVEGCKDHALSQESDSPPLYETAGGLLPAIPCSARRRRPNRSRPCRLHSARRRS